MVSTAAIFLRVLLASAVTTGAALQSRPAGTVPLSVNHFEEVGEVSYDNALAGRLAANPGKAVSALETAWIKARAELKTAGPDSADLAAGDAALHRLSLLAADHPNALELAHAINATTEVTDRFFAVYHPRVPPELMRLDYLGRELDWAARARSADGGQAALRLNQGAWSKFRPRVAAAPQGQAAATSYDKALASASNAFAAKDYVRLRKVAFQLLELLDRMEKLF